MTLLSDWLNMQPSGCGITGVTEKMILKIDLNVHCYFHCNESKQYYANVCGGGGGGGRVVREGVASVGR